MGARVALTLVGAWVALTLGGALEALNWTVPAGTKVSWTGPTLGGAQAALTLGGARAVLTLVGALESWTEPAETKMSWAGPVEELESTCEELAPEGDGEEQALGLGSKPSPHNPLTSPGAPGGARVARNWTETAETKMSWAGSAKMSWAGPAEMKMSWMGPAETKMSWTGPAEMKMSWAGPAETPAGLLVPRTVEG